MKKYCLLLFLLVMLLAACTPALNTNVSSEDLGCEHVLGFSNREEYEAYISTKKLPRNFVHWDSVAGWGEYIYFVPTTSFPTRYTYTLRDSKILDENTHSIRLEITHNATSEKLPTSAEYQVLSVTKEMPDMRLVPSAYGKSVIIRNGIEYLYSPLVSAKPGDRAGLNKITWYYNGVRFELTGQIQRFSSPLMHKLLSISETEAAEAFAEIKQSLDAN